MVSTGDYNKYILPGALEDGAKAEEGRKQRDAALAQLIKGKQMDEAAANAAADRAPSDAGKKQASVNAANLGTLNDPALQNNLNQGGSVKVGDLSAGADPLAHLQGKQTSGDNAARMAANKVYMGGLSKIQPVIQAAGEGLDLANDPKNIGSLGTARTLMLKSMGMNRYNENEAKAVLPPSLQGTVATLFNAAGGDESPLNESQRNAINQFFKGQLENAASQHDTLKQNAMNTYGQSVYATPMGQQALQGMGSPIEAQIKHHRERYKDLPQTQGPNLTSQPNPGLMDRLSSWLKGAPKAAPTAGAPAMSFEEFKKAKAEGRL